MSKNIVKGVLGLAACLCLCWAASTAIGIPPASKNVSPTQSVLTERALKYASSTGETPAGDTGTSGAKPVFTLDDAFLSQTGEAPARKFTASNRLSELPGDSVPAGGPSPRGSCSDTLIWENCPNGNLSGFTWSSECIGAGCGTVDSQTADDFEFIGQATITDVHWTAGAFNPFGPDPSTAYRIRIFLDDGTGTAPTLPAGGAACLSGSEVFCEDAVLGDPD